MAVSAVGLALPLFLSTDTRVIVQHINSEHKSPKLPTVRSACTTDGFRETGPEPKGLVTQKPWEDGATLNRKAGPLLQAVRIQDAPDQSRILPQH